MSFKFIQDFKEGQKLFGETIAVLINSVLLTIVYIVGVGLTSIVAKVFGKHFLEFKRDDRSYWKELDLNVNSVEEYYKQF